MTQSSSLKKVLIVDDEPGLVDMLASTFEVEGKIKAYCATNAAEAINILSSADFDLVISDFNLPGGKGTEILVHLRESNPAIPFIFFMAGATDITDEDALNLGADHIIYKPCFPGELFDTVTKYFSPIQNRWKIRSQQQSQETIEFDYNEHHVNLGFAGFSFLTDRPVLPRFKVFNFEVLNHPFQCVWKGEGQIRWSKHLGEETIAAGFEILSLDRESFDIIDEIHKEPLPIARIPKACYTPNL